MSPRKWSDEDTPLKEFGRNAPALVRCSRIATVALLLLVPYPHAHDCQDDGLVSLRSGVVAADGTILDV